MPNSRLQNSARVFSALGDETRLRLVKKLSHEGPQSITSLVEVTEVTRQAVSKHLSVLEDAGLVRSDRQGRECIWQIEPKPLSMAKFHLEQISQQWDKALERLRSFVEE